MISVLAIAFKSSMSPAVVVRARRLSMNVYAGFWYTRAIVPNSATNWANTWGLNVGMVSPIGGTGCNTTLVWAAASASDNNRQYK